MCIQPISSYSHFQLQATPFIGSKTLKYPISYFTTRNGDAYKFHAFEYPMEQASVASIGITPLIANAFLFIPGKKLSFEVTENSKKEFVNWEVFTDAYNSTFLYCSKTNSSAHFVNNGTLHYFTEFYGDKNSLLYLLFLGAHKIVLGYYQNMEVSDLLPIEGFYSGAAKFIQDFVAPFKIYLNANYRSKAIEIDDLNFPKKIRIIADAKVMMGSKKLKEMNFELILMNNRIESFKATDNKREITATCLGEV